MMWLLTRHLCMYLSTFALGALHRMIQNLHMDKWALGRGQLCRRRTWKIPVGYFYYIGILSSFFLFEGRLLWIPVRCNWDAAWMLAGVFSVFPSKIRKLVAFAFICSAAACQMLLPLRNSDGQNHDSFHISEMENSWEGTRWHTVPGFWLTQKSLRTGWSPYCGEKAPKRCTELLRRGAHHKRQPDS